LADRLIDRLAMAATPLIAREAGRLRPRRGGFCPTSGDESSRQVLMPNRAGPTLLSFAKLGLGTLARRKCIK
jgi:hypothetical protein